MIGYKGYTGTGILLISAFLVSVSATATASAFELAGKPNPGVAELNLEKAISDAKAQNPAFKRAEDEVRVARWRKLEALSAYIPHVSARGQHLFDTKYQVLDVNFGGATISFPAGIPQTDFGVEASWLVFDGFGAWHQYRAASLGHEAAELDYSRAAFQLEREVRQKFYQALASQIILSVADQNIKSLEEHLSLSRAMVKSGYGTRFDSLRTEAQLEEAKAEKLLAQDNLDTTRRGLSRVMGVARDMRPLMGALPVPDEKAVPENLSPEQAAKREDIESLGKREEAANQMSSSASSFWVPKVSLFASEDWYKFGNFDPAILPTNDFRNAYMFGLRLSWDLFDGGSSLARSEEAAARASSASQTLREAQLRVSDDVELWKKRYLYNTALYKARLRTLEKSEESVRLARTAMRAGTRTGSDLLDAELDLFRSRAGLVKAQVDAALALTQLELSLGRPL